MFTFISICFTHIYGLYSCCMRVGFRSEGEYVLACLGKVWDQGLFFIFYLILALHISFWVSVPFSFVSNVKLTKCLRCYDRKPAIKVFPTVSCIFTPFTDIFEYSPFICLGFCVKVIECVCLLGDSFVSRIAFIFFYFNVLPRVLSLC